MDEAVSAQLDTVFGALADPTRRDILRRVGGGYQLTVGQLAGCYNLTFAAISKHLKVLENAGLIVKDRVGRRRFVRAYPAGLKGADDYLEFYRHMWENRMEAFDNYINEVKG